MAEWVWRVVRTRAGEEVFAGWVWAHEPEERFRRSRLAVGPRPKWMDTPGTEVLPSCPYCAAPMLWRAGWRCEACMGRGAGASYDPPTGSPRALPREALAGVPLYSAASLPKPDAPAERVGRTDVSGGVADALPSLLAGPEDGRLREEGCESTPGEGGVSERSEGAGGAPILRSPEGDNSTDTLDQSTDHANWLASVEALTSFHRKSTAARYVLRGTRRGAAPSVNEEDGTIEGGLEPTINHWHLARAKGQASRFQWVSGCGAYEYGVETAEGKLIPIEKKCDCWRVCGRCLKRRKYRLGEGMRTQRELALKTYGAQARKTYRGGEGKWSEKLITFTVPHGNNPADDARVIVHAWQRILRKVRTHLVERGAYRRTPKGRKAALSVPWCRALEVAPGQTGGHAHLHVWWFGPFLDVVLLRAWWGEILQESRTVPTRRWSEVKGEGRDRRLHSWLRNPRPDTEIPWPVVDIETSRSKKGEIAGYTQKVGIAFYVVKGTELQRLSPAHVASIYEVFEGTRAVQWARGWAPKKGVSVKRVRLRRLTEKEVEALWSRIASSRNVETKQALLRDVAKRISDAVAGLRAPT